MDDEELEKAAYAMQDAYLNNNNRENACIDVRQKHPDADQDILRGMWQAIDAFYDMNVDTLRER